MTNCPTFWACREGLNFTFSSHMACSITTKALRCITLFVHFMFFATKLTDSHSGVIWALGGYMANFPAIFTSYMLDIIVKISYRLCLNLWFVWAARLFFWNLFTWIVLNITEICIPIHKFLSPPSQNIGVSYRVYVSDVLRLGKRGV